MQTVFHLIPDGSILQWSFNNLRKFFHIVDTIDPWSIGNIFKNRFGEGIRLLEYHTDFFPEIHHIDFFLVDIQPVD